MKKIHSIKVSDSLGFSDKATCTVKHNKNPLIIIKGSLKLWNNRSKTINNIYNERNLLEFGVSLSIIMGTFFTILSVIIGLLI